MPDPTLGVAAMIVIIFVCILVALALIVLLSVLPFWMICKKAGFPGPLALLMLVPVANMVLPFYIAFAQWPVLRQRDYRPIQQG